LDVIRRCCAVFDTADAAAGDGVDDLDDNLVKHRRLMAMVNIA